MSKYLAISFCSHAALLLLLLSVSETVERDLKQNYDQNNVVIDIIPIIQRTVKPDNLHSPQVAPYPHATAFSKTKNEERNSNSTLTHINQKVKVRNYDKNLSMINTSEDNKRSAKTKPILPISDPPPNQKFKAVKTPNFAKAKVANMAKTQTVPYREILTPTPKPGVKADLHMKNLGKKNMVEMSNSPKPKYPQTRDQHQQNTTKSKLAKKAMLKFNNEFLSQFDPTKNVQFSMKTMSKKNKKNTPLASLHPNFRTDRTSQCKLIRREKTGAEPIIRKIQQQIQSRSITISNILTYRSQQKTNEITISNLLASQLNSPLRNQQRASDNIEFLLTTNSFQDYAEDLVCIFN